LTHKRRADAYGVAHEAYSRTEILARWKHTCAYCGGVATHLDHVEPLSKGGTDTEANIVPACAPCNLSKGAKTLAEWAETFGPEAPPF
jgi:5-methylcytosine-specific restriction endonuclease McrA